MSDPTSSLHAAARAYVQQYYAGLQPTVVRIVLSDGRRVELAVSPGPCPLAPGADLLAHDVPDVTRTERRILKAVAALETDEPTGPEVAAAAKLPYEPELRKLLAGMRKKGLLGGQPRDQGYPATVLGLATIQEET